MIYSYEVIQQGSYHIKNDIVCQDAVKYTKIEDNYVVGAVADGLGSEKYSDIASKIAVELSVDYCKNHISINDPEESILDVIKKSFRVSLDAIIETAKRNDHNIDQYDTTLCLVVYINGVVYYGNSGDSGIIVYNNEGKYYTITKQQRDENGYVFPLFFGEEKWEFGAEKNIASVLLATDGMYETFFPYLLKNEENEIYVSLADFMMNKMYLDFEKCGESVVQEKIDAFIAGIPGEQVSDDKTVLLMMDSSININRQPDEYYLTPNWDVLKKKKEEEFKKKAYPHLFGKEE